MSKKKMCKYADKNGGCNASDEMFTKKGNCPMYWKTTVNCEMLSKYSKCKIVSPKKRYKRMEAWLFRYDGEWAHVHTGKKPTAFAEQHIPCTILIETKYLKEKK